MAVVAYNHRRSPERNRQRQAFAALLAREMMRQGLNPDNRADVAEAAHKGEITSVVLTMWLKAKVVPDPYKLVEFNNANNFDHLKLIQLLGWV